MPSATKKSPMFAPAASARCGRNATTTPQWAMNSRSMAISGAHARRNAKPRRRRATSVGPCVVACSTRRSVGSGTARSRTITRPASTKATAISATPCSDVSGEDGQGQRRDDDEGQVVGAPDEREAEPAPVRRDEPRDQRQGRRQRGRDADPLEDAGRDERRRRAAGLDAGQEEDRAADQVGQAAGGERPQATDAVDDDAGDERGGDLDQRRGPDDQPDLRIRDSGPGQGDGQRCRERMEPGLHGEESDGEPEHAPIIGHAIEVRVGRRPRRSGPWRVGGSAGPAEPGGLAGTDDASRRRSPATYPAMHSRLSGPARPADGSAGRDPVLVRAGSVALARPGRGRIGAVRASTSPWPSAASVIEEAFARRASGAPADDRARLRVGDGQDRRVGRRGTVRVEVAEERDELGVELGPGVLLAARRSRRRATSRACRVGRGSSRRRRRRWPRSAPRAGSRWRAARTGSRGRRSARGGGG